MKLSESHIDGADSLVSQGAIDTLSNQGEPLMNNKPFQWSIWLRSRTGLVTMAFLAIVALYLITAHTAHVLSVLPSAVFLIFMLLMHGGHAGHGGHEGNHSQHDVKPMSEHSSHTDESAQYTEDDFHHHEELK